MVSLEFTVLVGKVFLELSKMPAKGIMTLKFLEETRKKNPGRGYKFEGFTRAIGILAQSRALQNHPPSQLQGK